MAGVTSQIRMSLDSSGIVSGANTASRALDELRQKLEAAQSKGDWSEAAKITQEIAHMQNPGFSVVGGGNGGNGSNLQNTTQYNNARQLDIRLETITRVISTLTDQLKESTEKGQSRESFNISAALNNAEQEKRQLEAEKKRLETADKSDSSVMDMIKKYGVSRYLTQGLNYANQIAGIGFNHRIAMANGDYLGADVAAVESGAGIAQGIGGSLLGAGMMLGATPVGWGLMALGGIAEIGGAIAKYWAGDERADIAEGEAYRKTLAGTNALNKRFSDGGTWLENSNKTDAILRDATNKANGTGLSTEEFLSLATRQSKFGGSQANVMAQTRDIAMWAQATGTDAGVIQNFLGTARRYGDNSDVLGYASQARQAAGLTKAQNEEFLTSLQSVIEDGIANGYVKSAEDVSKTFVMFSRLSNNNPLWQGEQGAKRLAQMNAGISSATALQSASDIIVAGAARDVLSVARNREKYLGNRASGTYIDEMLLMEQGTNPEMFGAIANSVKSMEGSNIAAQIERYKDIFKLNYAGAVDVYGFAQKIGKNGYTESDFASDVAAKQQDRAYQSEETKWQDDINQIAKSEVLGLKSSFWQSLGKLDKIAEKGAAEKPASDGTDLVTKAIESASSPEVGLAIAESLATDNTINMEALETPLGVNMAASLVAGKASEYGDYGGAVRAFISGESGISFASRGGYKINDDSVYARLYSEGVGNDELDKLTMEEIGRYAALGYKKGGLFGKGGHKADGEVDEVEIDNAIRKMQKNKNVKSAYDSGDTDSYLAALRSMLKELFGDITIKSE